MIAKLQILLGNVQTVWKMIQNVLSIKGGLYVDLFGLVMVVRLLAVLKGFPPVSGAEAAVWGTTVGSLAYTNGGPKQ